MGGSALPDLDRAGCAAHAVPRWHGVCGRDGVQRYKVQLRCFHQEVHRHAALHLPWRRHSVATHGSRMGCPKSAPPSQAGADCGDGLCYNAQGGRHGLPILQPCGTRLRVRGTRLQAAHRPRRCLRRGAVPVQRLHYGGAAVQRRCSRRAPVPQT